MGKIMLQQHNALATLTWSIDDRQMSSPKQALLQQLNKQLQVSDVDRIKGHPNPRAVLLQNAHFGTLLSQSQIGHRFVCLDLSVVSVSLSVLFQNIEIDTVA